MITKKKVIMTIAVLVVLITGVMLLRNQEGASEAEKKEVTNEAVNKKVSVKIQQAKLIDKASGVTFKASLEASEEGIVSSRAGGEVVEILFEGGKYVRQGEPLIKLDDKEAKNNLRAAESQLQAAQASLKSAEVNLESEQINFDRMKILLDNNGIAKVEFENAERALKAAKASLEAEKAGVRTSQVSVENLRDSLSNTVITAPISGIIDEKNVNVGQNVDPGAILGKIKNISPINAVIEVEQNNLEYIKVGQKAQLKIGEGNLKIYEGIVKNIDISADPTSRNFKCKIGLDNKDQTLRPGTFAKAEILNNQKVEAIVVPIEALVGNEGSYYVYINYNGVARKRSVAVGETDEDVIEIKSGVQKGESVVCTNVSSLQDGDAISVSE